MSRTLPLLTALLASTAAFADEATAAAASTPTLNSGDTAWMLTATALVLLMTIPGLLLFYGGLVRAKNALSVLMQCFAITCLVTVIWTLYGFSLAFSTSGMEKGVVNLHSFVGSLDRALGAGISKDAGNLVFGIPESVFFVFQLTFAIITPALIVGAFAERMKFSAMLLFMALWVTLVYFPIAHMVWSGDGALMWDWGVLDFAGGTVVHINAGVAGLICALMLGPRKGYPERAMKPHSLVLSVVGACLLWIGWFGFNAGSAVAADMNAGMAMLVTQVATATAALSWMVCEWLRFGKPSVLGIISGAVAGLVAITPASGTAGPIGALIIGVVAGPLCFAAVAFLKRALGYDDSLDAFGVHGVGGFVGAILTGVCAAPALGGFGSVGTPDGPSIGAQVWTQFLGTLVTIAWSGIGTAIILGIVNALIGLRVSASEEEEGLDLTQHGEEAYAHSA
ncbi:MAG: ammonium transporter [Planctomycetes bacterium]|nr:ammonium transporter [Planctomycetota bacterium]